jgi:hypothetical protein
MSSNDFDQATCLPNTLRTTILASDNRCNSSFTTIPESHDLARYQSTFPQFPYQQSLFSFLQYPQLPTSDYLENGDNPHGFRQEHTTQLRESYDDETFEILQQTPDTERSSFESDWFNDTGIYVNPTDLDLWQHIQSDKGQKDLSPYQDWNNGGEAIFQEPNNELNTDWSAFELDQLLLADQLHQIHSVSWISSNGSSANDMVENSDRYYLLNPFDCATQHHAFDDWPSLGNVSGASQQLPATLHPQSDLQNIAVPGLRDNPPASPSSPIKRR